MAAWGRADLDDYRRLPLRAHALFADIPLHDAWRVTLPGGGPNRSIRDVRSVVSTVLRGSGLSPPVRALFSLRAAVGRVLRWDRPPKDFEQHSLRQRLTEQDRAQSAIAPGTPDGPFQTLFVHEREAASEVRNATVHAVSVMALRQAEPDYELFWAIYVWSVGRWTGPYMAAIDPFRRLLVYPTSLRRIHRAWTATYAANAEKAR